MQSPNIQRPTVQRPKTLLTYKLLHESGLLTLLSSSRDVHLLCFARFIRLFAYGASFLILVSYLSSLGISDARVGLFMTMTMLGDVVISFVLTLVTDRVGRRKVLMLGSGGMVLSGLCFAVSGNYWVLLGASVVGVISPSGNEIGPFRAVEEAILSHLVEKDVRSDIFAWYTLFGTLGAAVGTLLSGFTVQSLEGLQSWTLTGAYRVVFFGYALLGMAKLVLTLMLSSAVELEQVQHIQVPQDETEIELEDEGLLSEDSDVEQDEEHPKASLKQQTPIPPKITTSAISRLTHTIRSLLPQISPTSRSILYRLMLLFFMDSFASGLASPSWLTYFFTTVHSLQPSKLGTLFMVTNIVATLSNLAALPLARRLGPLKTMVFTHLPSAIFLAMIPLPPPGTTGTWISMALLTLRACTQSMDQAPRQAFLAAALLPEERTAVLGMVNVVKTIAQASGLGITAVFAAAKLWIVMFGGAGALKAGYDLFMLWMFSGMRDRESTVGGPNGGV